MNIVPCPNCRSAPCRGSQRCPTPDGYILDVHTFGLLLNVKRRLYGDGSALTPDARRDLAITLDVIASRAMPVTEGA